MGKIEKLVIPKAYESLDVEKLLTTINAIIDVLEDLKEKPKASPLPQKPDHWPFECTCDIEYTGAKVHHPKCAIEFYYRNGQGRGRNK